MKTARNCLRVGLMALFLLLTLNSYSQSVGINEDGSAPNVKSILDIKSNIKGLLIPRMTTMQRTSMTLSAAELGMMVYDNDLENFMFFTGTEWKPVGEGASFWKEFGADYLQPKGDKGVDVNTGTKTAIVLQNNGTGSNMTMKVVNETGTAAVFATGTNQVSGYPAIPSAIWARGLSGGNGIFSSADGSGTGILAQSLGEGPAMDAWAYGTGLAGKFRGGNVEIQQDASVLGNIGVGGPTAPFTTLNVTSSDRLRGGYFLNTFNSAQTTFGIFAGAHGTGTGEKRGGSFEAVGGTGLNLGVRAFASDGNTNIALRAIAQNGTSNWAGYFEAGDVFVEDRLAVGTSSPISKVHFQGSSSATENVLFAKVLYTGNSDVRCIEGDSRPANGYGYGGFFTGGYRGVYAKADGVNSTRDIRGIFGYATGTAGYGTRIGLYGSANNGTTNYGLRAYVNSTGTTNYGVYGTANGASTNWAGYFASGNVYIANDLRIGSGASGGASGYKVAIDGKMIIEEVRVQNSSVWPDYVFTPDYDLPAIDEVAVHIKANKHLPGIPSAAEVEENGHHLGEMQVKMLEKIEELTLYIIQLNEELDSVKKELEEIKGKAPNQSRL